jgi:NAD(P)-dependent dehydrogenase (short-subunit alcohol dehydrogenase family)
MQTDDLTGRTVLVTGAGSGIGRETALLSARRGARLVISDVNQDGLDETAETIRGLGRDVLAERVDVSDREQMRAHAESVHERWGPVDLLVNNAGVGLAGKFLDTQLEDWDWVVSINLMGVVHGCHFFIPPMVQRGSGHVVNVSSMAGYNASPELPAYSATKFAVLGLSEALREELKPSGVGVTAICPGIINTPITRNTRMRGHTDEDRERAVKLYARRNYTPARVAENILRSVQRGRVVAPVSPEAWFGYGLKRVSPRLAGWVIGKSSDM